MNQMTPSQSSPLASPLDWCVMKFMTMACTIDAASFLGLSKHICNTTEADKTFWQN